MANALSKAVEAFELLAANPEGLTVTDVAHLMETSKSTSSRLLASLIEEGLVYRDAAQRHFLDVRFWTWGMQAVRRIPVFDIARPHIAAAVRTHGVSVFMAILREDKAVYLESTAERHGLVDSELVSYVVPAYACAPGKAMLAFSPEETVQSVLDGPLVQFTPLTHATRESLSEELDKVRRQGYAVNRGEHQDSGRLAVAAPVFDQTGLAVAAICFYGFIDEALMERKVQPLLQLAAIVSASLGSGRSRHAYLG